MPKPADVPGQAVVTDHPGHIQILDDDRVVGCHEAGGQLVQPVAAGIGHAGVQRADSCLGLAPPVRPDRAGAPVGPTAPGGLTLGSAQRPQHTVEVARVGHDLSGGEHGQGCDAQVDTDHPATGALDRSWVGQLHGECDVPAAPLVGQGGRADPRGPGLHLAGEAAGRFVGADLPDPGKLDVAAVRTEPEGAGGETAAQTGTPVARLASPAEYASLLFSRHHGARSSLASFHARRRLYADQSTGSVSWSSRMS